MKSTAEASEITATMRLQKKQSDGNPEFTGDPIMRDLPIMPKITAATGGGDPTKLCFRYRGGRRHRRLYDVLMTLNEPGGVCHVEVCHALPAGADLPPFAAGRLNAARLTRAVNLIGLVKQVTSRDHTRLQPGRLVFDAHMQLPWRPVAGPASTRTQRTAGSTAARHALSAFGALRVPVPSTAVSPAQPLAHLQVRYPLHGLGRGARLKRHVKAG
jgi:hypothetical protein